MKNIFRNRVISSKEQNKKIERTISLAGIISVVFFAALPFLSPEKPLPYSKEMQNAAKIMNEAISVIRDFSDKNGIKIDEIIDPNRTGLIGPEMSPLTTTIGHLDAKRTTTNPNMASLIVHLLKQAGVNSGDTIAIGSSGSFPALMVASLAASKAMNVNPQIIISLGASSYGATKTEFNLLDIYKLLLDKKIINVTPIAISLGGEKDVGETFSSDLKKQLISQIQDSHIPFLQESNLVENVLERMKIYNGQTDNNRVSAFINCGGSFANMGISNLILKVQPGLNIDIEIPPEKEQGVIFRMAQQNIPIIHLLFIKGLALKNGLPWDPVPLPKPGDAELFKSTKSNGMLFWSVSVSYFFIIALLFFYYFKKKTTAS